MYSGDEKTSNLCVRTIVNKVEVEEYDECGEIR